VELAPWSETLAVVPVTFPVEGLIPVSVSISEDLFPADDRRYTLAEVRGGLNVSIVGTSPTATTWLRAAKALDGVVARKATLADASGDVVFIAGWRGEPLAGLLQKGTAVVIQPGEPISPEALAEIGIQLTTPLLQPLRTESMGGTGWTLRIAKEDHPVFSLFATGTYGDPANGSVRRRVQTPAGWQGEVLLKFSDHQPALTECETATPLVWWNLDLGTTDWPTRTAFLPFFGEFLRHLSTKVRTTAVREFESGTPLRLDASATDPSRVQLLDERDSELKLRPENPQTVTLLRSTEPARPGSYRWAAQGTVLDRAIVNFPEVESDLRTLTQEELKGTAGLLIAGGTQQTMADLREGKPLWPWFIAAAALFFLSEGILLRGPRRESAETLSGKEVGIA
jgi:hypothetical protein